MLTCPVLMMMLQKTLYLNCLACLLNVLANVNFMSLIIGGDWNIDIKRQRPLLEFISALCVILMLHLRIACYCMMQNLPSFADSMLSPDAISSFKGVNAVNESTVDHFMIKLLNELYTNH